MDDVRKDIQVSTGRYRNEHIAADDLAAVRDTLRDEQPQCVFHDTRQVEQDAEQMRMGFEDRGEHLAATAGNVDHSADGAKIISLHDGSSGDRRTTSHRVVENTCHVLLLLEI